MLTRPVSTRPVTAPHIVDPRFTRTA